MHERFQKKKKKNSNLTFVIAIAAALIVAVGIGGYFLFRKNDNNQPVQTNNLGEQQRQQVHQAASQLVGSILDNQDNFNQLTTNPDGTRRNIDDIEEIFLVGSLNQQSQSPTTPAPAQITSSLSPEVIEQTWYELRVFIFAGLQNPKQSLIENARLRIKNDIEKWLKWELEKIKGDYNKLLEEYLKVIQELKTVRELFEKYSQIRTNLVINKVDRSKELIAKGYSDIDISQLKEWNLFDQEFPNLYDKKRIGVTNALSAISTTTTDRRTGKVISKKITGGISRKLLLFLKPSKNHSSTVYFPPDKIKEAQQNSVREIIKSLLENQSAKLERIQNYDIYILRVDSSHDGAGPSSGVAHYLALYSALNKIPLPSNLASTGTIEGTKVGAIGGLQHKLEASVKNGIDTFILSHKNKKSKSQEESFDDTPHDVENKIKQVHFISQVDQIEIALNEISNNTVKEKVHICGDKIPEKKPEKPEPQKPPQPDKPNSEITSEQLLTLITELSIRDNKDENQDFWEKLQAAYAKNPNYKEALSRSLMLQKEYQGKLEKLQNNPNQNENQEKIKQLQGEIAKLEEEIKLAQGEININKDKIQQLEQEKNGKAIELQILLKESPPPTGDIETEKKELYQEYQTKFKEITFSVVNLTTEILTNLQKLGYTIQKITWTGELQVPSLTTEPAVSFSLSKNK